MAAHSDSRTSTAPGHSTSAVARTSRPDRNSWNPYGQEPAEPRGKDQGTDDGHEREAIPPPADARADGANGDSSLNASQANDMLDALSSLTDKVKDGVTKDAIVDTVKRFTRGMQQTVAKLGGVMSRDGENRPSDIAVGRFSMPARQSLSNSLDGYRPDRDVVAPISVRPNAMELLWVCGDCGQHYQRARECPEQCSACGAPKQHFYAPIED